MMEALVCHPLGKTEIPFANLTGVDEGRYHQGPNAIVETQSQSRRTFYAFYN